MAPRDEEGTALVQVIDVLSQGKTRSSTGSAVGSRFVRLDRAQDLRDPIRSDEVHRPPVPEEAVSAQEPFDGRLPLVEIQQSRQDELHTLELAPVLGVGLFGPEPPADPGGAHAQKPATIAGSFAPVRPVCCGG
jgi:hypothetical protein